MPFQNHLYVKVGQFQLPFAIKQKDHNILVRHGYGLGSNKRDVGVELGGTAGKVFYNAALFNADTAAAKGGLGTIGAQLGPIRAGVSGILKNRAKTGNGLSAHFSRLPLPDSALKVNSIVEIGVKSPLSRWMPLILKDTMSARDTDSSRNSWIAGRYGLFDPDRTIKGDASQRVTLTAQYNFMENGALSLFYWANLANADRNTDDTVADKGTLRQLQGTDQIILMSHFWF